MVEIFLVFVLSFNVLSNLHSKLTGLIDDTDTSNDNTPNGLANPGEILQVRFYLEND